MSANAELNVHGQNIWQKQSQQVQSSTHDAADIVCSLPTYHSFCSVDREQQYIDAAGAARARLYLWAVNLPVAHWQHHGFLNIMNRKAPRTVVKMCVSRKQLKRKFLAQSLPSAYGYLQPGSHLGLMQILGSVTTTGKTNSIGCITWTAQRPLILGAMICWTDLIISYSLFTAMKANLCICAILEWTFCAVCLFTFIRVVEFMKKHTSHKPS